ncbi:MAG TPA: Stp1/IreP family PP2C-type Ser/Thr phosphatase [Thermoleophilaceae bacterium]|nr:Stp1/IreP family PP2C-type Ser/Thr phosphatase [Thermoleophilaceae bacterium]
MLRVVEQYSLTDVGRQRNANEDALFEDRGGPLFAVADGMGGARAGEVAAKEAVDTVAELRAPDEVGERALADLVERANRRIHDLSQNDEALAGMGTTMTMLAVGDGEIAIAHVGDSRAYRLRGGELERLTHDHTLVDEMVRAGRLTPEEAQVHPQRSVITRALGPEPNVEVERMTYPARADDVYLICSDGLTSMVPEDGVGAILRARSSLKQAAEELVRAANEAGGRDNITVVLFKLGEEGQGAADDQATMVAGGTESLKTDEVRAAVAETPAREPEVAEDATMVFGEEQKRAVRTQAGAKRPEPKTKRGPGLRRAATVLVTLLIVGAITVGFWVGSRQFYFVGTDDRGLVALYRGLPYELPLGLELWEEEYSTGVPARLIPESRRERVLDHRLRGEGDAVDLIKQVERGELED